MATRRYGTSTGDQYNQVTEAVGAAVASDAIELTVDLAASPTREQVILAIERIKQAIMEDSWPPA